MILVGCGAEPEALIIGHSKGSGLKQQPETENDSNRRTDLYLGFFEDSSCTFRLHTNAPLLADMPTHPCRWMISEGKRLKLEIRFPGGDIAVEAFSIAIDGGQLELHDIAPEETSILLGQGHRRCGVGADNTIDLAGDAGVDLIAESRRRATDDQPVVGQTALRIDQAIPTRGDSAEVDDVDFTVQNQITVDVEQIVDAGAGKHLAHHAQRAVFNADRAAEFVGVVQDGSIGADMPHPQDRGKRDRRAGRGAVARQPVVAGVMVDDESTGADEDACRPRIPSRSRSGDRRRGVGIRARSKRTALTDHDAAGGDHEASDSTAGADRAGPRQRDSEVIIDLSDRA